MRTENDNGQERQPLLSDGSDPGSTESTNNSTVFWQCITIMVLVSISGCMIEAPQTRLYEKRICTDFYKEHNTCMTGDNGNIPESRCKCESIQGDLAMIFSRQGLFDLLASMAYERCHLKIDH
jgi:hypothetical protein